MTVVFGKLADTYGRKPMMLLGIAIFLIGSVLAGCARSMLMMIVFRLVQGVGAGAIQPVAMTIVADLYPARERGKVQGYLASVWAISAVIGPMTGGLIIRDWSWPWIFWINVPVGIVAAAGFSLFFVRSTRSIERRPIDILGAGLFTVTVTSLLIALTEAGRSDGLLGMVAVAIFCISSILFISQERRALDPMISFALWSRRPIAAANAAGALASMTLMGLDDISASLCARRAAPFAGRRRPHIDNDAGGMAGWRNLRCALFQSVWAAAHPDHRKSAHSGRDTHARRVDGK